MTYSQPEGFLAVPPTGIGPGVLVLHAWWGLNDTIKAFCTQLAGSGFEVFAPDLYHGKVAATIANAEALGKALDADFLQAKAEIAQTAMFLDEVAGQADRDLAVIAFPWMSIMRLTSPQPIRNTSAPLSFSMGRVTATTAAQKQPTSVTLPRTISSSRNPT